MTINEKHYPKVIVYRKWMTAAAGLLMVLIFSLVFYNLSHQTAQKKEKKEKKDAQHPSVILATTKDMAWMDRGREDMETLALDAPVSNSNSEIESKIPIVTSESHSSSYSSSKSLSAPDFISAQTSLGGSKVSEEAFEKRQEEKEKAMMIPITNNQLVGQVAENTSMPSESYNRVTNTKSATGNTNFSDDLNNQAAKEAFVDKEKNKDEGIYLDKGVIHPRSPYELQAGTLIPGILVTGINSDLPGQIVGQIRQNVYDSITGNSILVPQGAKVVGLYDSKITYGQERVLVVWKRIIFPNGQSLDLSGMPGVDLSGYAGFEDKVNNHFTKIFGSVLLLSTLSAGAQLSQPNNNNSYYDDNYPTIGQTMAQSLGTNLSEFGTQLANKNLNIQPTLMIRPGYLFNISVTKDMVFPGPYGEEG